MTSPFTKLFAILLAAFGVTSLIAAVPVAVWEGDFKTTSKNNVTFDANGNTVAEDENGATVTIAGEKGALFTLPGNNQKVTVLFKYSELAIEAGAVKTIATFGGANNNADGNPDQIGICAHDAARTASGIWGGNRWTNKDNESTTKDIATFGSFALVYQYGAKTQAYVDGEQVYNADQALQGNTVYAKKIGVGGKYSTTTAPTPATGMVVSAVAIFAEALTADELIAYKWPSEVSDFTASDVSGEKNWSDLVFEPMWVDGSDKAAVIKLSGDATITLPDTLVANKVTFVGDHTATLVYTTTPAVGQWLRKDGAKIERIVTSDMINAGFTADAGVDFIINQAITPTEEMGTVTVPANATLKIRNCTATPKFGQYTMNGTLVIEQDATMIANRSDLVEFHQANEVHVYGTLDLAATRQTLYPRNKFFVYGGANIIATVPEETTIDGGANINTIDAGAGLLCRKGTNGENTATISAIIGPQAAPSTIDVEEGLTITLSATAASSVTMRQQGLIKTGLGTLKIEGNLSTLASIRCDEGTLDIAAGSQAPKIDVASTGTITADNSVAVVLLATDAQLQAGFSTTIAGGASVTCVDTTGAEWSLTQDGNTYSIEPVVYTFTAGENSNWSNTANWSTGKLPREGVAITLSTDVTIDTNNLTLPTLTTVAEGVKVVIPADKTLVVNHATGLAPFAGAGTLKYTAALALNNNADFVSPFTFAEGWSGTLHLTALTMAYGNFNKLTGATKIKLTGASGYLAQNTRTEAEIILENNGQTKALLINNGNSSAWHKFAKLSGTGTLEVGGVCTASMRYIIEDGSDYTGLVNIVDGDARAVVFGNDTVAVNDENNGAIIVAEGHTAYLDYTRMWSPAAGKKVRIVGTLDVFDNGNAGHDAYVYTNFVGTGTIRVSGTGFFVLPNDPEHMWAETLGFQNEKQNGVVISRVASTVEKSDDGLTTIGTLSGTKDFRSDWNGKEGQYRAIKIVQSKNSTWSGAFTSTDRLTDFIVAGADGATEKTLTLAGTSTHNNNLIVKETGAVAITGTWVGNVAVAGTIGGTGLVSSGTVTFADGATVKYTPGETALSATFAAAAGATVKVVATAEDLGAATKVKVLSWTTKPAAINFVGEGLPKRWSVVAKDDGLWLIYSSPMVFSIF